MVNRGYQLLPQLWITERRSLRWARQPRRVLRKRRLPNRLWHRGVIVIKDRGIDFGKYRLWLEHLMNGHWDGYASRKEAAQAIVELFAMELNRSLIHINVDPEMIELRQDCSTIAIRLDDGQHFEFRFLTECVVIFAGILNGLCIQYGREVGKCQLSGNIQ